MKRIISLTLLLLALLAPPRTSAAQQPAIVGVDWIIRYQFADASFVNAVHNASPNMPLSVRDALDIALADRSEVAREKAPASTILRIIIYTKPAGAAANAAVEVYRVTYAGGSGTAN